MKKIGFMQTSRGVIEVLPKMDQFSDRQSQRKMFLRMLNCRLDSKMRFGKNDFKNLDLNLLDIFKNKVFELLWVDFVRPGAQQRVQPIVIFKRSSLVINNFFRKLDDPKATYLSRNFGPQKPDLLNGCEKESILDVARLILQIDGSKRLGALFDMDELFLDFVFYRVKKQNKDKTVTKIDDAIAVTLDGKITPTLILPAWKKVARTIDSRIDSDIRHARGIIEKTAYKQVYLVYPKADGFSRHQQIKFEDYQEEYRLKMIPYSFSFCKNHQRKSA